MPDSGEFADFFNQAVAFGFARNKQDEKSVFFGGFGVNENELFLFFSGEVLHESVAEHQVESVFLFEFKGIHLAKADPRIFVVQAKEPPGFAGGINELGAAMKPAA